MSNILNALDGQCNAEMQARYFYEAAKLWARRVGYMGAERQFGCFAHWHKHLVKKLHNLYADHDIAPVMNAIAAPGVLPNDLPSMLTYADSVESALMAGYETATRTIFNASTGLYIDVKKIQKYQISLYQAMDEYVSKLSLINTGNRLDVMYFDRKILQW